MTDLISDPQPQTAGEIIDDIDELLLSSPALLSSSALTDTATARVSIDRDLLHLNDSAAGDEIHGNSIYTGDGHQRTVVTGSVVGGVNTQFLPGRWPRPAWRRRARRLRLHQPGHAVIAAPLAAPVGGHSSPLTVVQPSRSASMARPGTDAIMGGSELRSTA